MYYIVLRGRYLAFNKHGKHYWDFDKYNSFVVSFLDYNNAASTAAMYGASVEN